MEFNQMEMWTALCWYRKFSHMATMVSVACVVGWGSQMLKNPTEVAPLAEGPGAGLYDVDAVLATVVKAWEDQMYQPEVLMKAAFHKFDDNGDGVLNSTEFHNLVINFNKTATERDSLRMFKDALDAAAEHGFTGGTISPEVRCVLRLGR